MVYNDRVRVAMGVANSLHANQYDKGGYPYIHHLMHVAEQFDTTDEVVVALLHDSIEDYGEYALQLLRSNNISANCIEAILALTRMEGETYDIYIDRVSNNKLAMRVKVEDLKHNLDASRHPINSSLIVRYTKALSKLSK